MLAFPDQLFIVDYSYQYYDIKDESIKFTFQNGILTNFTIDLRNVKNGTISSRWPSFKELLTFSEPVIVKNERFGCFHDNNSVVWLFLLFLVAFYI